MMNQVKLLYGIDVIDGLKTLESESVPKEIPRLCISAGCPQNGTVLDPFSGSGTTGEIALKLGRRYIGIDLNKEYEKLVVKRIGLFALNNT